MSFTTKSLSAIFVFYWNFNPSPDDKILTLSKLKSFVDDNLNDIQNIEIVIHKVENIMGKGQYSDYQNFVVFQ